MSRFNHRIPLDNLPALDATAFNKFGLFSHEEATYWTISNSNNNSVQIVVELPSVRVVYRDYDRFRESEKAYDYFIYLESTRCHYGGRRWWFLCPCNRDGAVCGRRVRKLYLHNSWFGCKWCHNLCYSTQNENHRSVSNRIYRVVAYGNKANHILSKVKHRTYKGVPTKNMNKYYKYMRLRGEYLAEGIELLEGLRNVL